ncbi:hypothetical protein T492DRAFT_1148510 [Pavlovales sp. CCMP2436]|nr:hypothetical protein T492DRAFT_1148510 [Pavlovales sp. CCMP2436]
MAREAAMHKIEQELEQQCLARKVQYDPPPTGEDNTARRARRRRLRNTCTSAEQLGDAIDVPAATPLTGSRQKKWRVKQRPARDDARQANLLEQRRLAEHDLEARCADCGADYVSAPDREDEPNQLKRWDMLRARCARESARESARMAALLEQLEQQLEQRRIADDELEAKCVERGVDYKLGPEDEPDDNRLKRMQILRIKCLGVLLDREFAILEWPRRDDPDPQAVAQWEEVDRALALCRAECDEFDYLRHAGFGPYFRRLRAGLAVQLKRAGYSSAQHARDGHEVRKAAIERKVAVVDFVQRHPAIRRPDESAHLGLDCRGNICALCCERIDCRADSYSLNDVKEDFYRRFPHGTQKDDSYWDANACWCKKYAYGSLQAARDSDCGLPSYNFTYTMRKPPPYRSPEINHLFQDARERTTQAMIDYLVQECGVRMIMREDTYTCPECIIQRTHAPYCKRPSMSAWPEWDVTPRC